MCGLIEVRCSQVLSAWRGAELSTEEKRTIKGLTLKIISFGTQIPRRPPTLPGIPTTICGQLTLPLAFILLSANTIPQIHTLG